MIASDLVMGQNVTIVTGALSTIVAAGKCNLGFIVPRKSETPLAGFGYRLNQARKRFEKEITHQQIAAAVKVSRVAVTKWEGAVSPKIRPDNLFGAADFLKVRARWLAIDEGPMEIKLPNEATRLAEDWAALPIEYQAAIRKHVDDLLAAVHTFPQLRNPVGDERVGNHPKPAPERKPLARHASGGYAPMLRPRAPGKPAAGGK